MQVNFMHAIALFPYVLGSPWTIDITRPIPPAPVPTAEVSYATLSYVRAENFPTSDTNKQPMQLAKVGEKRSLDISSSNGVEVVITGEYFTAFLHSKPPTVWYMLHNLRCHVFLIDPKGTEVPHAIRSTSDGCSVEYTFACVGNSNNIYSGFSTCARCCVLILLGDFEVKFSLPWPLTLTSISVLGWKEWFLLLCKIIYCRNILADKIS